MMTTTKQKVILQRKQIAKLTLLSVQCALCTTLLNKYYPQSKNIIIFAIRKKNSLIDKVNNSTQ